MRLATPTIRIAALLASALLVGSAPAGASAGGRLDLHAASGRRRSGAARARGRRSSRTPCRAAPASRRPAATLLATRRHGGQSRARSRSSSATRRPACAAPRCSRSPQIAGPQPVTAKLRSEKPGTTVHFRVVVTTAAGQVVGADQAFTTVANPTRLAPGTTMLGVRVGYLTPAAARAQRAGALRPARSSSPGTASAGRRRRSSSARRRTSTGRSTGRWRAWGAARTIPVTITVDPAKVERYVDYLDSLYARPAQVGSVTRVGRKAELVEPLTARAVQKQRMETIITRTLKSAHAPADRAAPDRDEARRARAAVHRRPARGAVADALQGRRRRPQHAGHDRAAGAADARRELRHRLAARARTPSSRRGRRGIRTTTRRRT